MLMRFDDTSSSGTCRVGIQQAALGTYNRLLLEEYTNGLWCKKDVISVNRSEAMTICQEIMIKVATTPHFLKSVPGIDGMGLRNKLFVPCQDVP